MRGYITTAKKNARGKVNTYMYTTQTELHRPRQTWYCKDMQQNMHKTYTQCSYVNTKHATDLACICRSFRLQTRWGWCRYPTSGLARSKASQCTYLRSLKPAWIVHRRSASGDCSTDQRKALGPDTQQTLRKVNASFFHPYCSARRDDVVGTFSLAQNFFCGSVTLAVLCLWSWIAAVLFRSPRLNFARSRQSGGPRGKCCGLPQKFVTRLGMTPPPLPLSILSTLQSCEKVQGNGEVHVQ